MTIYGIGELAEAIRMPANTVSQWYKRGKLPPPTAELRMGPVWTGAKVERWIKEQRRR